MLKHLLKNHLSKWDIGFLLFLLLISGFSIYVGDYWNLIMYGLFAVWVLILASNKMVIEHQQELIEKLLELSESVLKGATGAKTVRTITTEYTLEREKKSNGKNVKSKPKSGRSPTAGKTGANAKASRPNGVSDSKPKRTSKNSKA